MLRASRTEALPYIPQEKYLAFYFVLSAGDLIIPHQTICTNRKQASTPNVPADPHLVPIRARATKAPTKTPRTPLMRTSRDITGLREKRSGSLKISTHCQTGVSAFATANVEA